MEILDNFGIMSITAANGIRFNVSILREGDAYGTTRSMIWVHEKPGVEFYDARHPHTPLGQFASRYFVEDILEGTFGLDLLTYVAEWKIDPASMEIVRAWLRHETGVTA